MKNNWVTVAVAIVSMVMVAAVVIVIAGEDRMGPVISFNIPTGQQISYKSGDDQNTLIKYAKATDNRDGDVSDTLMIENVYVMPDLATAKVVYVARDKSHNISKENLNVSYVPSEEEVKYRDTQNADSTKASKSGTSGATSAVKGSTQAVGTSNTQTTAAVTSTASGSAKPVLVLKQAEVSVEQGSSFYINSYVKSITDDKDDSSALFRRIIINGSYDLKKAGDYTINVYCTDTDGNASNSEKFVIHVTAKAGPQTEETPKETEAVTETTDNKETVSR